MSVPANQDGAELMSLAPPASIPGFERRSETVDGVRIHYLIGGNPSGPPILLWHGFLSTSYGWRHVAPALAAAGAAVLIPDMRGYGDSDKPAGTDGYDARALGEEFRALVRQIGFGEGRKLTLVGHDMGAHPALLWAADHPEEIATLFYIEVPVMLSDILNKVFTYSPEAMAKGSMWWWILPLAPGVPERLIVGNERTFLDWFFDRDEATGKAVDAETRNEYQRTFSGNEGVLGALGVYRAAFTTIAQTEPLTRAKVQVPVVALGGGRANGARVRAQIERVAENVSGGVIEDGGHFVPEERPDEIIRMVLERIDLLQTAA
jgi:pimeloyl-ACP methyl ester carboxylesterase